MLDNKFLLSYTAILDKHILANADLEDHLDDEYL